MAKPVQCDICGFSAEVALRHIQSTPSAFAQRDIVGPVAIDTFAAVCSFIQESGRRLSGPGDCLHFNRAIDAALAAGRL